MKSIPTGIVKEFYKINAIPQDASGQPAPESYPSATIPFMDVLTPSQYFFVIDRFQSYAPHFYSSIRLLLQGMISFGIGPILSQNTNGQGPFILSQSAKSALQVVHNDDGCVDVKVKRAPDDVIESILTLDPTINQQHLKKYREIHSIKGGLFVDFLSVLRDTWAYKQFNYEFAEKKKIGQVIMPTSEWIVQMLKGQAGEFPGK